MRRITRVHLDWAALCLFLWAGLPEPSALALTPASSAWPDDPTKEAERRAREQVLQRQRKAEQAERAFQRIRREQEVARQIEVQQRLQVLQAFNRDRFPVSATVEQLVFGRDGGLEIAREQLEILQQREVDDVAATCQLTQTQKAKVALVCRGDMRRFFDRIEILKAQQMAGGTRTELEPQARELAVRFNSGLFRENSLLHRALPNLLEPAQLATFEKERARRKRTAHQIAVNQILDLVSNQINLSEKAQEKFTDFLLSETTPSMVSCGYDHYFVLLQLDRIPQARLESKLDGPLLAAVKPLIARSIQLRRAMEIAGYFADQANEKDE
jgi:hypothetical protein